MVSAGAVFKDEEQVSNHWELYMKKQIKYKTNIRICSVLYFYILLQLKQCDIKSNSSDRSGCLNCYHQKMIVGNWQKRIVEI